MQNFQLDPFSSNIPQISPLDPEATQPFPNFDLQQSRGAPFSLSPFEELLETPLTGAWGEPLFYTEIQYNEPGAPTQDLLTGESGEDWQLLGDSGSSVRTDRGAIAIDETRLQSYREEPSFYAETQNDELNTSTWDPLTGESFDASAIDGDRSTEQG